MLFLAKHKINWKYKIKYLDCKNYFINFIKQHPKMFIYSLIKNLIK